VGKAVFLTVFFVNANPAEMSAPAWLVQQQEKKKSGWEILADKKGRVTHRQLIPPSLANDRFFNESSQLSWVLEIIES
jgi:hypothetical protein